MLCAALCCPELYGTLLPGLAGIRVECEGPEMPRRALPAVCLYPYRGNTASWSDAQDIRLTDERGGRLFGKLRQTEDGVAMRTDQPLLPGLYTVDVSGQAEEWLGPLAGGNAAFPFAPVTASAACGTFCASMNASVIARHTKRSTRNGYRQDTSR